MDYKLENIIGIGKTTAEKMKSMGIDTVQKLASLKPDDLLKLKIKGIGKATAEKYINSAKETLKVNKKKKNHIIERRKSRKITKEERTRQAECNIGLVGHVDHGMIMSFRHFSG